MTKITNYSDIIPFPHSNYRADVSLFYLRDHIDGWLNDGENTLNLNPDFQRGHVWNDDQRTAFMEYFLRGGESGRNLYFNHPGWMKDWEGEFVIVDGLQRLTTALMFLENKVKVFGSYFEEIEGNLRSARNTFVFHVATLQTRAEVLQWYLDFNTGGTPHEASEIERVRGLLANENEG